MIHPMFWNLCKSSWLKGLQLCVLGVLIIISYAQDETLSSLEGRSAKCGTVYSGHPIAGGRKAGKFLHLGKATNEMECITLCCENSLCKTALYVGKLTSCYLVKCSSKLEACKPDQRISQYNMSMFKRSIPGKNDDQPLARDETYNEEGEKILIREKRHNATCHHYHGRQCSQFLDRRRPLYFNYADYPRKPKNIEKRLTQTLRTLRPKISSKCEKLVMQAICLFAFPYCGAHKKQVHLCRKDCLDLQDGVCGEAFIKATEKELMVLPNCTVLPVSTGEDCSSLNIPESLRSHQNPKPSSGFDSTSDVKSTIEDADLNTFKKKTNGPTANPFSKDRDGLHSAGNLDENSNNPTNNVNNRGKELTSDGDDSDENVKKDADSSKDEENINDDTKLNNSPDKDLQTPKRSDIPETEDSKSSTRKKLVKSGGDKQVGGQARNNTDSEQKPTQGLGLKESMGVLDPGIHTLPVRTDSPTAPTTKRHEKEEDHEEEDEDVQVHTTVQERRTVPTSPIPSAHSAELNTSIIEQPSIVNAINAATETNLAVTNKPLPTDRPTTPATHVTSVVTDHHSSPTQSPSIHPSQHSTQSPPIHPTQHPTRLPSKQPTQLPTQSPSKLPSQHPTQSPSMLPSQHLTQSPSKQPTQHPTRLPSKQPTQLPTQLPSKQPTQHSTGATTPGKPTIRATEAPPNLLVSAGDNKVLTLPANTIELYASAFPKETSDNHYTYHWQQISAPQGSHGYMEGKDTRRVILSKLSHIGTYQFKVTVTAANHAFGVGLVNVTVKPAPRVNKPPRADISPKEQTITLPTNEVVLDGSKSTDDDKIVKYKWEEMKGPLNDKNKMISSGSDSPVLQLKSLVPGIYTFKLTVIDSDGETDATTATVTVNDEKDYPPVARAGNDVVLTLPVNHVTMYGNQSTDDKGIVSYEWSKAPSSPAVGDMQGTSSPYLRVSNMVVGDYTFVLKVTDTGGQSATSRVTVVVQPEKNSPPVAKAGSDKDLVYPDDTTTLDAKGSFDDQKIVKYHWDQVSGPSSAEISGADERVVTVKKLTEGHYVFKLTVTDDKGLTGSDTVGVKVKKDINQAPAARAGPDVVVHLPNRAAELDGSKSSDDHGITEYLWSRDPKSPAAGDVINSSNHQAVLRLSNLVEGMYKFKLTVSDAKGLKSSDEALLTVKEDENSAHLVELFLDVDITKFTEENKGQLIRKLAVILDVQDDDIIVEHLKEAGTGHSMLVMFYVKGVGSAKDGQAVAEVLKAKIENEEGFFEFRMLKVEPYICRNNCSFHGYCDRTTKLCVCESFWMQNIFKASFGVKESNCDWSILYVTVIIFGIIMAIGGIIWGICFCMGRARRRKAKTVLSVEAPSFGSPIVSNGRRIRGRRRHRYAAIIDDDDDDDKTESMEMLPKGKYSSMMLSDSFDDDSDDETTLFEAKKRVMNGSVNGGIGNKHTF